eukprot:GHVH01011437.1.p1 GENE.GHVH01011437.1~~GHVH01011437.1.p1  ORF type:complete len:553 (+),score=77.33 GHVH01011437.1:284-1942(+)
MKSEFDFAGQRPGADLVVSCATRMRNVFLKFSSAIFLYFCLSIAFPLQPVEVNRQYSIVELWVIVFSRSAIDGLNGMVKGYCPRIMIPFIEACSADKDLDCVLSALAFLRVILHGAFLFYIFFKYVEVMKAIGVFDEYTAVNWSIAVGSATPARPHTLSRSVLDVNSVTVLTPMSPSVYDSTPKVREVTVKGKQRNTSRILFNKCFAVCPCDQQVGSSSESNATSAEAENAFQLPSGQLKRGLSSSLKDSIPSMWNSMPPPVDQWLTHPLYIRMVLTQSIDIAHPSPKILIPHEPMLSGSVYEFETDLFKGKILIRIRNVGTCGEYFEGRRRVHQCVVQGRFKRVMGLDEVWGGQVFQKPWRKLPPNWVVRAALSAVKILSPSMIERLLDEHSPFVVYPYISLPQKMNISRPGEEPDIASTVGIPEDCALLGGDFKANATNASFRRRYFTNLSRLKGFKFLPDLVYSFEDYQDLFDFKDFMYKIRVTNIDIADKLVNEPIEMCALQFKPSSLDRSTVEEEFYAAARQHDNLPYLWRVQLWNENALDYDELSD